MDDPGNANTTLQSIQGAWSTILTVLGGLIVWNGRRLIKQIDQKADQQDLLDHKEDVKDKFELMQQTINRLVDAQGVQHQQNTERLDTIIREVYRGGGSR